MHRITTLAVTATLAGGAFLAAPAAHADLTVCGDSVASYKGTYSGQFTGAVTQNASFTLDGQGVLTNATGTGEGGLAMPGKYAANGAGLTITWGTAGGQSGAPIEHQFKSTHRSCDSGLTDLSAAGEFGGVDTFDGGVQVGTFYKTAP